MNDTNPLVSICCLTYNQAPYIRKCLDGFLMQETTFPVEILIHDDASTDGTDAIILEYAKKYPEIIFPLFETENKYSNGFKGRMDTTFNYSRARGKYIASCEGDDYWTDPLKLQKQVDFMESHPEYSVCCHRCQHYFVDKNEFTEDQCGSFLQNEIYGKDISLDIYFSKWITQPLTILFRMSDFSFDWQPKYKFYRDTHEIYHLLKQGKGFIFSFMGGVYVRHESGIDGMIPFQTKLNNGLVIARELYEVNKDSATKHNYEAVLQWAIYHVTGRVKIGYCFRLFFLNGETGRLLKNLIR